MCDWLTMWALGLLKCWLKLSIVVFCFRCVNFSKIARPKMKIKERVEMSDITVAFGITAAVVGLARCGWYWQMATGEVFQTSQSSTDLVLFVVSRVLRDSGRGLEKVISAKALLSVEVLSAQFQPIICRAQCWVDWFFNFVKIWLTFQWKHEEKVWNYKIIYCTMYALAFGSNLY